MNNYLIIGVSIVTFIAGIIVGCTLTWWWMNREWQRNPYKFRVIVDQVIARREEKQR
jgi:hypothetical protein